MTFADLRIRIEDKLQRANNPASKQAWQSLLDIVDEVTGETISQGFDAVTGRRWSLVQVDVQGYQGVGVDPPLHLTIDPTPGVTVIHGPNGAGKSSLADAIDSVLHGSPGGSNPAVGGSGGKAPLWERVQRGRDAAEARIHVTLADGDERLHLSGVIDDSDGMETWTIEHEHQGRREVVRLDSSWDSAVIGHQPVFAYGALERRIQTSGELQGYLDLLIALGGCFIELDGEVAARCTTANEAFNAWQSARNAAQTAVEELDGLHDDGDALPPVEWPAVNDDVEAWLRSQQLTELGDSLPLIDLRNHEEVLAAAEAVKRAISQLDDARISTLDHLAGGLTRLHAEAEHLVNPGSVCPVCGSGHVDWRSGLAGAVAGIAHLSVTSEAATLALKELQATAGTHLLALLSVVDVIPDSEVGVETSYARKLVQDFLAEVERSTEPTTVVLTTAHLLVNWCASQECRRLFEHAAHVSDRHRQRLKARREAVSDFVAIWRQRQPAAVRKNHWDTAKKHLATLGNALRAERAAILQERAGQRISTLLDDAGIQLESIEISKTKGNLILRDRSDAPIQLGMLSSGQRNALLLAPLLAMTAGGPFGFVVLDDPVHAFDGLRVDRLANEIVKIAQSRRVIVLTHDERLREHLLAVSSSGKAHQIARDHTTGVVTIKNGSPMWEVLLNDAHAVIEVSGSAESEVAGMTEVVRGLCRQALDDGLRDFVIRVASRTSNDVPSMLDRLNQARETRRRLTVTAEIGHEHGVARTAVNRALDQVGPYLDGWNRASHGNPPLTYADSNEIRAVRQACQQLMNEATQ
ncbi:AAA family ATPase [Kineosporia sp. NBRC 101677]|uniref:AAA family ATPase n=1 Tax=Kineosporia sp. NBRC 101677 TaxID=3032197 RepID=UPI002552B4B5|nr:AAA family ATPase [Kineosporia sp. NBRC 101677]